MSSKDFFVTLTPLWHPVHVINWTKIINLRLFSTIEYAVCYGRSHILHQKWPYVFLHQNPTKISTKIPKKWKMPKSPLSSKYHFLHQKWPYVFLHFLDYVLKKKFSGDFIGILVEILVGFWWRKTYGHFWLRKWDLPSKRHGIMSLSHDIHVILGWLQ